MAGRFNVLLHGETEDVIASLEDTEVSVDELRVALINALRRIARLEQEAAGRARLTARLKDLGPAGDCILLKRQAE